VAPYLPLGRDQETSNTERFTDLDKLNLLSLGKSGLVLVTEEFFLLSPLTRKMTLLSAKMKV
jgi:hypothetical protein